MQQALDGDIHRVARVARQDCVCEWIGQVGTQRVAGDVRLDVALAVESIVDRAITGAAAQVALEGVRQVGLLFLGQGGRSHDHAGGAKPALEGLRVVEGLLHRMQFAFWRKAFDRGDLAAFAAERGHQARMEWLAVDMDRAGTAVARVTAFLDAEHFEVAQEGAQALAGLRLGCVEPSVHFVLAHESSVRISSAR